MNYKMKTDEVTCINNHNNNVIRSIINSVISYHIMCVLSVATRQDENRLEKIILKTIRQDRRTHSLTYHTKNSIPNSN